MSESQITLDTILIMEGPADPTAGAGIVAPLGSFYSMEDGSGFYRKSGAADTDWTLVTDATALALKANIASPTFTGTVTTPAIIVSSETASTIASFDASKNIKSLALATYPSLAELAFVKGVTSAIQTQLNAVLVNYGDGSDGDVTISINSSLANNMYYNNLTVNNAITLTTNGYKIYVKGTLTNNGTIRSLGNNGSVGGNGTLGGAGSVGAAGTALGTTNEFSSAAGGAGGIGGVITPGAGGAGSTSPNGNNIVMKDQSGAGGAGGAGGAAGGAGGAAGNVAVFGGFKHLTHTFVFGAAKPVTSRGGSGGGGGGGSLAGGGGGGGGGGSSPYTVFIAANTLTNNGTISSIGGNGANGGNGFGNGGGGGGGNGALGGFIYLIYQSITVGTLSVAGGTKGTGGALAGTGANGNNGQDALAGTIVQINLSTGVITTT